MIEAYFTRAPNGLVLAPESPSDALDGIPAGDGVKAHVYTLRGRSSAFHRKFFALCKVGWSYTDETISFDSFRKWLTLAAGAFDVGPDGRAVPKSIAFAKMDDAEFRDLYSRALDYLVRHVLPDNVGADAVDAEVERLILGFA